MFKRFGEPQFNFRQDAGAGGGSGAGGAAGTSTTGGAGGTYVPLDAAKAAADLAAIQAENARLKSEKDALDATTKANTTKLKELHDTILSKEYLDFLASKGQGGGGTGGAGGDTDAGKGKGVEPDPNEMDNRQLTLYLIDKVKSVVAEVVKPVATKADQVDLRTQLADAAKQFPDFYDYGQAIGAVAEKLPGLDPTTYYILVRGMENVSGKSYKVQRTTENAGGGGGNPPQGGGVRRPASGEVGSGPSGNLGDHRQQEPNTYREAAGQAFDEIFGKG